MNEEMQALRDKQLESYRAEQAELSKPFRTTNVTPTVSINSLITKANVLLKELTALNVSSLNLGYSNTKVVVDGQLNYKIDEFYNVMKRIREDNKHSGKIVS